MPVQFEKNVINFFPVTAAPIEKGTIVIRGGRIEALGANVTAPQGAKVIDAKGGHVYPGFINARTTVGIGENGVRGYDDISEMHDYNQHLRTRVAYHPASETIPVARGTGVTTVGGAPNRVCRPCTRASVGCRCSSARSASPISCGVR